MRYSSLVERIVGDGGEDGADPWEVHDLAVARAAAGDDVTLLSIGQEADRRTPDVVVEAAVDALRAGHHHYTEIRGQAPLREAVARYHERLTGSAASADEVTVFAGAQNALFSCAQALLEPGDEVVLIAPWYTTYPSTFATSGARVVPLETRAEDGHRLDVRELEPRLTPATRVVVLNVPSNPIGHCPDAASIAEIVRLCVERRLWLVLDTVYLDVVEAAGVALPHALPGAQDILVTVGSLSKSHRMSGWRIGWTVSPTALAAHFDALSMCMHYGLPPFVQAAATVALERAAETPRVVADALATRRRIALAALGDVSPARLVDSGRGFFVLLDVAPLGLDARAFALDLLARHDVSVLPCGGFGPGGRTLVRIGLCVDGERLRRACEAIRDAVAERADGAAVRADSSAR